MEATDFLGNTLAVGDKVVYMSLNYRDLRIGWIMKITPCMVFISQWGNPDKIYWHKQSHNQVIKI